MEEHSDSAAFTAFTSRPTRTQTHSKTSARTSHPVNMRGFGQSVVRRYPRRRTSVRACHACVCRCAFVRRRVVVRICVLPPDAPPGQVACFLASTSSKNRKLFREVRPNARKASSYCHGQRGRSMPRRLWPMRALPLPMLATSCLPAATQSGLLANLAGQSCAHTTAHTHL